MDQGPDSVETLTLASAVETLTLDDDEDSAAVSDPLSPSTRFTSPSDLCFELDSLHDLALRGQWRSVLDKVSRARSLSLLPNPHDHLVYLAFNALALFKLRRFADSAAELDTLDSQFNNDDNPFSSPRYLYESHPHSYPTRSGSMIPFSIRYIHAELPQRLGDRPQTLDRLYSLLDLVRRRIADNPQSSQWPRRELFLMSAICSNHFSHREFDVALSLTRDLLARSPSDPVLLSRLGYIQMQIGDLDGSKASFARAEKLGEGQAGATTELENLAARNRAMVFMVEKDYVSAVREYEECIERDPADVVALNNKALCLMYSRDLSDSIKVLEGALERVPTSAVNETLVVNLCSMYELAYVNHGEVKTSLNNWIAKVAPDDFDPSCTRI